MKADIARALETVARCHANGPCPAPTPALIAIIAQGVGHRGRVQEMLGLDPYDGTAFVVALTNLLPKEDHAALAAYVDGQWLILDNRTLTLVSDTDVMRAIPEYVLDQNGVSRFVRTRPTPGRNS